MTHGSLFTGIGGFDLAGEQFRIATAWQVECDKNCLKILSQHFPNSKRFTDVKLVGRDNLEPVDLITGGFPCQDLSVAGKRAGLTGERSGLWFEFARVIDELEPIWVVIENVPGLLSSNSGRDFATIVQWLVKRGYGVAWRILNAQYFGVPQRRRRVFIVGSFGNGRAAEILFESEGLCGDTPASGEIGKDYSYSLRANPSHSGDRAEGGFNTTVIAIKGDLFSRNNPERQNGFDKNTMFTLRSAVTHGIWEMSHASEAVRLHGDKCPALQSRMGTGGNQVPMVGVRRLTPLECERLQGFPDNWTAGLADSARYRMLGNAVAVPVVQWIMRRLAEIGELL